ncbi:hypothetical protein BV98_002777 [Sphingobium herbicidovorans NBRC 16415]|uniref:Uncharacterized protein n=1 Tax=Sphingobium herbicidovorans (strain ATCC 700291 / DSM 11019 / CCUG 56400 / KCTC 2939 / LMG 18315 / NBRC 16415 / MH) TaxID=1219045 RepID=A0A086P7T0_SPHHM|nr:MULTISPECIES: hypothetical protein [Sphingomonadaceae]KFG89448.1 hypothetical protein BV98_002777 [Sphingobium herbicidovorans NBRC 16415]
MSDTISLAAARLQQQVPAAEARIDDAIIAASSLMTSVVTARRDTPGVPAVKAQSTIHRIARLQTVLVGASGDALRIHGELADIARETGGLDLHECPAIAGAGDAAMAATS